ncbi:MAG: putative toxin-antitoxin system toxin component, PIN family [Rhodothermales bacterium]|nr:putative toxin-antitoxin system toxin component, PIN family [Rhodothermales bacterium]
MKIVLDTSVLVAGLRSRRGASNRVLQWVASRKLTPLVTTPLFLEYEAVLKRAEHQLATGLGLAHIDAFLSAFASAAVGVETHYRWRPQLRDIADEMVLECVVNGGADYLITFNVKDFQPSDEQFGYQLMSPGAFAQEYEQS